ncbi:hypothetical protein CYMTET_49837 [Cymbomonas tetramitiformis]|uniref:Uncharacterized protein n=1 Tax=Cymbomonas tetramitiformis TaxID=36881 RepID=A0AAE0BQL9_9CHLO|nr:hypothetical protein CYMTET_49837 [Cymbomonas tetramitiformis]
MTTTNHTANLGRAVKQLNTKAEKDASAETSVVVRVDIKKLARRKKLLYCPYDNFNPYPPRPQTLESRMPQLFDLQHFFAPSRLGGSELLGPSSWDAVMFHVCKYDDGQDEWLLLSKELTRSMKRQQVDDEPDEVQLVSAHRCCGIAGERAQELAAFGQLRSMQPYLSWINSYCGDMGYLGPAKGRAVSRAVKCMARLQVAALQAAGMTMSERTWLPVKHVCMVHEAALMLEPDDDEQLRWLYSCTYVELHVGEEAAVRSLLVESGVAGRATAALGALPEDAWQRASPGWTPPTGVPGSYWRLLGERVSSAGSANEWFQLSLSSVGCVHLKGGIFPHTAQERGATTCAHVVGVAMDKVCFLGVVAAAIGSADLNQPDGPISSGAAQLLWVAGPDGGLILSSNSLTGAIPTELGRLTRLIELSMQDNLLTSSLPTELMELVGLNTFNVGQNRLLGTIPTDVGNLVKVGILQLYENSLTGNLPTELGQLTSVVYLNVSFNSLEGKLPSELGSVRGKGMREFEVSNNKFTGSIPSELAMFYHVTLFRKFHVQGNSFAGKIPTELGEFSGTVTSMKLNGNILTGAIPTELGKLTNLRKLDVSENTCTSSIPTELGSIGLRWLTDLKLNGNILTGAIPTELGKLLAIKKLDVSENTCTSSLPTQLGSLWRSINDLYLSSNNFTGALPTQLAQLAWLTKLYAARGCFR